MLTCACVNKGPCGGCGYSITFRKETKRGILGDEEEQNESRRLALQSKNKSFFVPASISSFFN